MQNKAIAYFSNGLGNFILMMPALQALKELSGDKVDLCLNSKWRDSRRRPVEEICEKWEIIDKIIDYPTNNFNPNNYKYWFYSSHNSNCDITIMFKERLNHVPISRPSWRSSRIHEHDHYMEIVRAMGYKGKNPQVNFPLAEKPLLELQRPIIALCNGSFNTKIWERKHWKYFNNLVKRLKGYFGSSIIGIGNENELKGVDLDYDGTGKHSITESAFILTQCDLLISTDSGCMHLADILNIPLIALFGSTLVSKNGPLSKKSKIIQSQLDCAPCQDLSRFTSCENPVCMDYITVSDVMVETRKILLCH